MNPTTTEHHHPITHLHPPPSLPQSLLPPPVHVSAYLQTLGPFLFAPTKADPSRGEGSHSPSGPALSLSLPCRMVTEEEKKKEKRAEGGGEKKAYSPRTQSLQSVCLLVTNVEKKKKNIHPQLIREKAYFLCG